LDSIIPAYLFVHSPHDLRNPKALADLEQMAARVISCPASQWFAALPADGQSLEQARLAWQAGEVGNKLNDASQQIHQRNEDLDKLTHGADHLADALGQVRDQVGQAMAGTRGLVDALTFVQSLGGGKTFDDIDKAAKMVTEMHNLGQSLGVNIADVNDTASWAGPILIALNATPVCSMNPDCVTSRNQLQRLADARNSGALNNLSDLAKQLQATQGTDSLESTARGLRQALSTATNSMRSLAGTDPAACQPSWTASNTVRATRRRQPTTGRRCAGTRRPNQAHGRRPGRRVRILAGHEIRRIFSHDGRILHSATDSDPRRLQESRRHLHLPRWPLGAIPGAKPS